MKEAKTVLRTKAIIDGVEQDVLIMPITRLDCIEDSADITDAAADKDYIPVMDSKDNGQMKKTSVEKLIPKVENKADKSHTHDDRYYTETEIDTKLASKASSSHTHTASDISDLPASLTVDDTLSSTSTNPVQNKVVKTALDGKLPTTGGTITGNLAVTGTVTGSKVYNAVWGADYAEGFDYEGDISEPGKIVELCGNNKVRTASAGSDMVIGVSSASYWALAGCSIEDIKHGVKVAVGIAGQLPIKVRGAVKYGDYIVCGGDGIGEARNKPSAGQTVGRAMESNASPEIKDVNCIIQIR